MLHEKEFNKLMGTKFQMSYTELLVWCDMLLTNAKYINDKEGIFSAGERIQQIIIKHFDLKL